VLPEVLTEPEADPLPTVPDVLIDPVVPLWLLPPAPEDVFMADRLRVASEAAPLRFDVMTLQLASSNTPVMDWPEPVPCDPVCPAVVEPDVAD